MGGIGSSQDNKVISDSNRLLPIRIAYGKLITADECSNLIGMLLSYLLLIPRKLSKFFTSCLAVVALGPSKLRMESIHTAFQVTAATINCRSLMAARRMKSKKIRNMYVY